MEYIITISSVRVLKGRYYVAIKEVSTLRHIAGTFIALFQKDKYLKSIKYNRKCKQYLITLPYDKVLKLLPEKGSLGNIRKKLMQDVCLHNTYTKKGT